MRQSRSLVLAMMLMVGVSGCGSVNITNMAGFALTSTPLANSVAPRTAAGRGEWPKVEVRSIGRLPTGVVGNALVMDANSGDSILSIGGYTGQYSITPIYQFRLRKLSTTRAENQAEAQAEAHLPVPLHDGAAGFINSDLYVFGGGQSNSDNTIVRVRGRQSTIVGRMATKLSDAVCVPFKYHNERGLALVGGYDDKTYNQEVRFVHLGNHGLRFDPLFKLPIGLRYPAVAVRGDTIYVAGGKTPAGISNHIYSWSASSNIVRDFCTLPYPVEKAAAIASADYLLVAGGLQKTGRPTARILGVNLVTSHVKDVGTLPTPLADMGYCSNATFGYLAGGMKSARVSDTNQSVLQIRIR